MTMRVDNMLEVIRAQRKAYKLYNTPRISDYAWYVIGKVRLATMLLSRRLDERMATATWKIQKYRAVQQDYIRREKITKEAYHNGGCSK